MGTKNLGLVMAFMTRTKTYFFFSISGRSLFDDLSQITGILFGYFALMLRASAALLSGQEDNQQGGTLSETYQTESSPSENS